MQELITKVSTYVEQYMSHYDGSHDFNHIKRVVGLAHLIHKRILESPSTTSPPSALDRNIITLAALLHDIGDRKYIKDTEDPNTMIRDILLSFSAPQDLAEKVQTICLGVSYSSEIKDFAHVKELIERYPELAVVQDADRIDSLGAVGIGRVFTYGGAKTRRGMADSLGILEGKLYMLEGLMKTEPGRELASERTRRLHEFHKYWKEETEIGELDISMLGCGCEDTER